MPQLFKQRANAIAELIVIGVPLVVLGSWATFYSYARSDFWTGVDVPIEQAVPFSHKHHVADNGIDCRYCHTSVEDSAFAGIPPTETCMTCHSQIFKEAPMLQPVRASLEKNEPLRWTRVHDLPDYVYFNHSIHVNKGIACATCHGRVDEMPLTRKVQPLYMRWCLDCHRDPAKFVRPKDEVVNMTYSPPKNQHALGQQLLETNHVHTAGLTDCYTCHR